MRLDVPKRILQLPVSIIWKIEHGKQLDAVKRILRLPVSSTKKIEGCKQIQVATTLASLIKVKVEYALKDLSQPGDKSNKRNWIDSSRRSRRESFLRR